MKEPIQIAILGLGTVGTGVVGILTAHAERMERQAGRPVRIKHIVVRDPSKPRAIDPPSGVVHTDFQRVVEDCDVEIVVELMGGLEPARTILLDCLRHGKNIVTANKALLAQHGATLFNAARTAGRAVAFEAAVAGGVPVIVGLGQSLAANQILSLSAILNGTSNFIVTQMEENGAAYDDALKEAQHLGFAEADPTMDVDGTDAAQKLAILTQLAFRANVPWQSIPRRGIDTLQQVDMQYAAELGYRVKLLADAHFHDQSAPAFGVDVHVAPCFVRKGTPLAEVRGAFNAVSVVGDVVGRVFFQGLGAGQQPTASAVVADLIDMTLGRAQLTFDALKLWSPSESPTVPMRDPRLASGRYYLRMRVDDHSGVLAEVSGLLSEQDISIASVIQHELASKVQSPGVDLVIMTHATTEGAIQTAISQLTRLDSVLGPPITIRVLD